MSTNNPKNKAISLFLLLLVLVFGVVFTYIASTFKENKKVVTNNGDLVVEPRPETSESEGIAKDPIKDWKTYENKEYGFSFRYPEDYFVEESSGGSPELVKVRNYNLSDKYSVKPGTTELYPSLLSITFGLYEQTISVGENLENWLKVNGEYISAMSGVPISAKSILVNGNQGLELTYAGTGKFYVFTNYKKVFYVYFNPNNSEYTDVVWQILSTFEFLNDKESSDYETTDVVVRNTFFGGEVMDQSASRYTFKYPSKDVSLVDLLSDGSSNVSGILIKLNNGVNLTIKPSFEGSSVSYNDVDGKPSMKKIDNSNLVGEITRILGVSSYSYVTGYGEGATGCSHWDPLPLACHMSNAGFNKIGGYEIICNTKDISKVKMCDDIVGSLAISVEKIK